MSKILSYYGYYDEIYGIPIRKTLKIWDLPSEFVFKHGIFAGTDYSLISEILLQKHDPILLSYLSQMTTDYVAHISINNY
jgi:hypothetical protein